MKSEKDVTVNVKISKNELKNTITDITDSALAEYEKNITELNNKIKVINNEIKRIKNEKEFGRHENITQSEINKIWEKIKRERENKALERAQAKQNKEKFDPSERNKNIRAYIERLKTLKRRDEYIYAPITDKKELDKLNKELLAQQDKLAKAEKSLKDARNKDYEIALSERRNNSYINKERVVYSFTPLSKNELENIAKGNANKTIKEANDLISKNILPKGKVIPLEFMALDEGKDSSGKKKHNYSESGKTREKYGDIFKDVETISTTQAIKTLFGDNYPDISKRKEYIAEYDKNIEEYKKDIKEKKDAQDKLRISNEKNNDAIQKIVNNESIKKIGKEIDELDKKINDLSKKKETQLKAIKQQENNEGNSASNYGTVFHSFAEMIAKGKLTGLKDSLRGGDLKTTQGFIKELFSGKLSANDLINDSRFGFTKEDRSLVEEFLEKIMNIIEHNVRKKCDGKTLIGIYKNTKLHFEHCSDFEYYTFNSILTNEEIFENFEGNEGTELEFYYNNKGTKRPCYCNELDLYFESCSDAVTFLEEKLNTRVGVISGVCNKNGYTGKLLNEKKCFWRYVNENDINDLKKYEYCIINKEKLYKEAEDKYKIYDFYISNKNNTYSVPCYCYELDMYFESYKSAATYCKNVLNISLGSIKNCVLGIASYSGKYNGKKLHWRKIKLNDREDVYKYNEYMLSHM